MGLPTETNTENRTEESASDFARYDQCRFAVFLKSPSVSRPLMGTAHHQRDDLLGSILRIPLETDSPGNPQIIVVEREWNGLFCSGEPYDCDYCLMLATEAATSSHSPGDPRRPSEGKSQRKKKRGGLGRSERWWG